MRALPIAVLLVLVAGCSTPAADVETTPSALGSDAPPEGSGSVSGSVVVVAPTPVAPEPEPPAPLPRFGIAVSPRSFEGSDFSGFFTQAADLGDLILWGGDAGVLADTQGAADVIGALAKQHDLAYGVQVGFHRDGQPFDAAAQQKASLDVVEFAKRAKPAFLALGVEVDRIYRNDPAWVEAFAAWYAGAYDEVKAVSPNTLVFPTFQLENVKGWTGGLYGGAEISPALWHVVAMFPDRDLTAFTTYPCYLYKSPSAIPSDYYTLVREEIDGPIAFTEVGWYAANLYEDQGWGSSAQEQADFLEWFLPQAEALDAQTTLWLHMHDQANVQPVMAQSMGLIGADGVKRPAYDLWYAATHA